MVATRQTCFTAAILARNCVGLTQLFPVMLIEIVFHLGEKIKTQSNFTVNLSIFLSIRQQCRTSVLRMSLQFTDISQLLEKDSNDFL